MIDNEIREKLQDIVAGAFLKEQQDHCTTIRNLLCKSFETGPTVKGEFESRSIVKKKQESFLKAYSKKNGLWQTTLPIGSQYLTKGGESKVYLAADIEM